MRFQEDILPGPAGEGIESSARILNIIKIIL
jgi:hypothetical protein